MHPQQQQGMGPCKTGIMLGGMMGAGIGGSAGIILGGAGGFFSGYRGFALLKQSAKLVLSLYSQSLYFQSESLPGINEKRLSRVDALVILYLFETRFAGRTSIRRSVAR